MTRKNFSKGIDSILGNRHEIKEDTSHHQNTKSTAVIDEPEVQAKEEITTRTTIYLNPDVYEQIKAIAYWDRRSVTSIIQESLATFVESKGTKYVNEAVKKYTESQR